MYIYVCIYIYIASYAEDFEMSRCAVYIFKSIYKDKYRSIGLQLCIDLYMYIYIYVYIYICRYTYICIFFAAAFDAEDFETSRRAVYMFKYG